MERAEGGEVGPGLPCPPHVLLAVAGDTDEPARSEEPARLAGRHSGRREVDPVSAARERDVESIVHEKQLPGRPAGCT